MGKLVQIRQILKKNISKESESYDNLQKEAKKYRRILFFSIFICIM
jgi:hypothetical protein